MEPKTDLINAVDRALDILLLLQEQGGEMGVTEISRALGIYKSTIYRTLNTLENKGFIGQNSANGKYWLGLKLYSLGMSMQEKFTFTKIVYPYAQALSDKFNEVVNVAVRDRYATDHARHIVVEQIKTNQILTPSPPVGSKALSHCSGIGKCLLAYSPPSYRERFIGNTLPVFTPNTIADWDSLLNELALIRKNGYAVDYEELEMGLICIAGPIFDKNQEIIAAISLSGPRFRIDSDKFSEIIAEVKKNGTIDFTFL
jgi:DNA-binding IclR family transcriptional regulator